MSRGYTVTTTKHDNSPNGHAPPRNPVHQVWYIVREGKDLRIMRERGEWKVVRVVHGKMAAAQRELKRMQR